MVLRMLVVVAACLAACAAAPVRAGETVGSPAGSPADVPLVLGDGEILVEEVPTERSPEAAVEVVTPEVPGFGPAGPEGGAAGDAVWTGDALPAACTACTGCPSDTWAYTVFDALFVSRANTAGPLAVAAGFTNDPGAPVITAGDVRYPTSPGLRVFQGWRHCDAWGWEVGYLGVWSMHADALATSPDGAIALPGPLGLQPGTGFDAATAIRPAVHGTLNSFEANVFATHVHDGCSRHDPLPWRRAWGLLEGTVLTADWLVGIRWAGFDEAGTLDVTALASATPPVFQTTRYRVTSSSQLVGPQIGHRRRVEWGEWAVEGWAKAALVASFLSQSQGPVVGPFDLEQLRGPRSASRESVGMIGDVSATLVRRLGDHWGLRAGYTLLWFSDVAPAANQWDFSLDEAAGTAVAVDTLFLYAATLGVEATW